METTKDLHLTQVFLYFIIIILYILKTSSFNSKLQVNVDVAGDVHSLPSAQVLPLQLTMNGGEKYDFLITETVSVSCLSKPERTLKISIR